MSERPEQDPLGFLFGGAAGPVDAPAPASDRMRAADEPDGSRADVTSATVPPATPAPTPATPGTTSSTSSAGTSPATPDALPSRRALRAAREAEALAAASADETAPARSTDPVIPAIPVAPESVRVPELQPAAAQLSFAPEVAAAEFSGAHAAGPEAPRPRAPRAKRRRRSRTSRAQVVSALGRRETRSKVSAAGAMLAITGLVAVVALPVYAATPNDGVAAPPADARGAGASAQEFVVAPTAQVETAKRDEFSATSAADLQRIYANALREQNMQAYLASGAGDLGDDYPWFAELSDTQGGGLSPLNYYYRECVDFVAWRLNRDKGYTHAPFPINWSTLGAGSAYSWRSAWESHGWATGTTPQVGAVAYFAGQNHVAYVSGILGNGDVLLEEYNYGSDHLYGQRIISASDAYYLYAPPIG
ncbi:MAG: CHAP domain-containing protein [Actinomycetales bacterium]|nr:CHAP domain-containing protein [Actinomycetales bacterium]